jgi:hypothetical protein
MAGVVGLVIFFIILAARRARGEPIEWSLGSRLWFWKGVQLCVLLLVFGAADPTGKVFLVPAFILLFAPSFVLREVVVALEAPRVAYWTARWFGPVKVMKESSAGAAVYGALALARRPSSPEALDWLELQVNAARSRRGAAVVAVGLLAALRGDRDRARGLFLIADATPRNHIPRCVRVIARDWLIADAARIGDWPEVVRMGRRGKGSLRWSYALARMAERLAEDPRSCRNWQLCLWWMIAPRRIATFSLLRRALAVPRVAKQVVDGPPIADGLPDALAGLARSLECRFVHDRGSLARAAAGVDAAIDLAVTRTRVQERLQVLGSQNDIATVTTALQARLSDLLVPLIEEFPRIAVGARGPILDQAIERVRARLLRDIEAQCKDYDDRQDNERSLNELEEWGTWAVTRHQAHRLLELSPESEDMLFHRMYVPVCNFAVFQHNTCRRIGLAYDMHTWLYLHSTSDPAATRLLMKNMKSGEA